MIEATGRVLAVESGRARIVVERQSSCGACESAGGCGTAALANWLPRRRLEFHVSDSLGLAAGERVVVGIDDETVRFGAVWLYAIPLLGMIAGGAFGEWLFARSGLNTELGAIGLGLSGLILALLAVHAHLRSAGWAEDARVRLLRRVVQAREVSQTVAGITLAKETTIRDRGI